MALDCCKATYLHAMRKSFDPVLVIYRTYALTAWYFSGFAIKFRITSRNKFFCMSYQCGIILSNRINSRRTKAFRAQNIWFLIEFSRLTWKRSILQTCLIARWKRSIHQCAACILSKSTWPIPSRSSRFATPRM